MKKLLVIAAASVTCTGALAVDHWVNGHYRSDGTYVQPHMQSNPNGTTFDNYSTKGNTNPYTQQGGTVDPFAAPALPRPQQNIYTPPSYPSYQPPNTGIWKK